jgi:organic radical activating enzyme
MLRVKEIFQSLQGEGPDVGTPAVFIRLAGCNLACEWCDTDFTTEAVERSVDKILGEVESLITPNHFVVITGGEPFLQPRLVDLLLGLRRYEYRTQIETNGTLWAPRLDHHLADFFPGGWWSLVCSPKPGHPVHPSILKMVSAVKIVVGAGDDLDDLFPIQSLGMESELIFLQPRDDGDPSKNQDNIRTAAGLCLKHGYRLSLQTHKLLGIK